MTVLEPDSNQNFPSANDDNNIDNLIDGKKSHTKRPKKDRQNVSKGKKRRTVEPNVSSNFVENQDFEIICLDDSDEDDAGNPKFDRQTEKRGTSKSVDNIVESTTKDNDQVQFLKLLIVHLTVVY